MRPLVSCLLGLALSLGVAASAQSFLAQRAPGGRVELSWTGAGYTLEQTPSLGSAAVWSAVPATATLVNGRSVVSVPALAASSFFRLRGQGTTIITESSPAPGEGGVAVTRETIFRLSSPLAADVAIDQDSVYAEFAGRKLLARSELSSDRRTLTLFYLENLPTSAQVRVVVEGDLLRDGGGRLLDADADGVPGGRHEVSFETLGVFPIPNTAVIGRVFASEKGRNGENIPLEGVIVTVDGAEETLRTVTGADGTFTLDPSPAGRFFVHVDGRTARGSNWPGGAYYPFVGKAWDAAPGVLTNRAGGSGEIFLPLIQSDALRAVSAVDTTRITFSQEILATNPALAEVSITVPPGALFADSGARGGRVGIAPVAPDRLPEPLPAGLQIPLVITIQTDGPLNFDRPVPVRFPNAADPVTGVKPPAGAQRMLFSFNHDTGRWEPQGLGRVTADGRFIETDPGVGVRQPGWHGFGPPPEPDCKGRDCDGCDPDNDLDCKPCDPLTDPFCEPPCSPQEANGYSNCQQGCGAIFGDCVLDNELDFDAALTVCLTAFNAADPADPNRQAAYDACTKSAAKSYWNRVDDCEGSGLACGLECDGFYPDCAASPAAPGSPALHSLAPHSPATTLTTADAALDQARAQLRLAAELLRGVPDSQPIPAATLVQIKDRIAQTSALAGGNFAARLGTQIALKQQQIADNATEASFQALNLPRGVAFLAEFLTPTGTVLQRGLTEAYGRLQFFRPPGSELTVVRFFDPVSGRYDEVRPPHPLSRRLPNFYLQPLPAGSPDADADGVADVGERVLGLDPNKKDTDRDGVPDGLELALGTNPADGLATVQGVFAGADAGGAGTSIAVKGDLAAVGVGNAGVTLFDISNPGRPLQLQRLRVTGRVHAVALADGLLAATLGADGIVVFDLSDPRQPRRLWQKIPADSPNGSRYYPLVFHLNHLVVGRTDGVVLVLDARSGGVLEQFQPVTNVGELSVSGDILAVLATSDDDTGFLFGSRFLTYRFDGPHLAPVFGATSVSGDKLDLQDRTAHIAIDPPRAYVGSPRGFNILEVSPVSNVWYRAGIPRRQSPIAPAIFDLAVAGTNRLVALEPVLPVGQTIVQSLVTLFDVSAASVTTNRLASFPVPGRAGGLALNRGIAWIASDAGLVAANPFAFDDGNAGPRLAPTVTLFPSDLDPTGLPLWRIDARADDDSAVRIVEAYLGNTRVAVDGEPPFELPFRAPLPSGAASPQIRLVATDLAGNTTTLTLTLADTTPPRIQSVYPPPTNQWPSNLVDRIQVTFDEAVRLEDLGADSLQLFAAGPDRILGTPDDILVPTAAATLDATRRILSLPVSDPLPPATYEARIRPGLRDALGNSRTWTTPWRINISRDGDSIRSISPNGTFARPGGTLPPFVIEFDDRVSAEYARRVTFRLREAGPDRSIGTADDREIPGLTVAFDGVKSVTVTAPQPLGTGSYQLTVTEPPPGSSRNQRLEFRTDENEWNAPGGGRWNDAANWSAGTLWNGDSVRIDRPASVTTTNSNFNVSLSALDSSASLALAGPLTLKGPGEVRGLLTLRSGLYGGGGTLQARGDVAIESTIFSGGGSPEWFDLTLVNHGTATWKSGRIEIGSSAAAWINRPGSELILQRGATELARNTFGGGTPGRFLNHGLLAKADGTNEFDFRGLALLNDGVLRVTQGSLRLRTYEGSGTVEVGPQGRLRLWDFVAAGEGGTFTGSGEVSFGFTTSSSVFDVNADILGDYLVAGPTVVRQGRVRFAKRIRLPFSDWNLEAQTRFSAGFELGQLRVASGNDAVFVDADSQTDGFEFLHGTLSGPGRLQVTGPSTWDRGTFVPGGEVSFLGPLALGPQPSFAGRAIRFSPTSVVTLKDSTLRAQDGQPAGTLRNEGRMIVAPQSSAQFLLPWINAGSLEVPTNSQVTFRRAATSAPVPVPTQTPTGRIELRGGEATIFDLSAYDSTSGTWSGTGEVRNNQRATSPARFRNAATLAPSGGSLTLNNWHFEQLPTGTLEIALDPTNPGKLVLSGNNLRATLGGTLQFTFPAGFAPTVGTTFDLITGGAVTGKFTTVDGTALGNGRRLEVIYSANAVQAKVVSP